MLDPQNLYDELDRLCPSYLNYLATESYPIRWQKFEKHDDDTSCSMPIGRSSKKEAHQRHESETSFFFDESTLSAIHAVLDVSLEEKKIYNAEESGGNVNDNDEVEIEVSNAADDDGYQINQVRLHDHDSLHGVAVIDMRYSDPYKKAPKRMYVGGKSIVNFGDIICASFDKNAMKNWPALKTSEYGKAIKFFAQVFWSDTHLILVRLEAAKVIETIMLGDLKSDFKGFIDAWSEMSGYVENLEFVPAEDAIGEKVEIFSLPFESHAHTTTPLSEGEEEEEADDDDDDSSSSPEICILYNEELSDAASDSSYLQDGAEEAQDISFSGDDDYDDVSETDLESTRRKPIIISGSDGDSDSDDEDYIEGIQNELIEENQIEEEEEEEQEQEGSERDQSESDEVDELMSHRDIDNCIVSYILESEASAKRSFDSSSSSSSSASSSSSESDSSSDSSSSSSSSSESESEIEFEEPPVKRRKLSPEVPKKSWKRDIGMVVTGMSIGSALTVAGLIKLAQNH